jgi:hypothetical protein
MTSNDSGLNNSGGGIDTYFRAVAELHHRVLETQRPLLAQVA